MVLRRYRYLSSLEILYRLVSSAMPEFKLVCKCAYCVGYKLVPKAYAECGIFANELCYAIVGIFDGCRISGAI